MDAVLSIEADNLRLAVRSARRFIAVFGAVFIPAFGLVAWFTIDEPGRRLLFSVGGVVIGLLTFGLIYALFWHHDNLGDYLLIDRKARMLRLPRLGAEFPLDQVFGLQTIRGRSRSSAEVETDLNLLVAEGNELVRYHICGSPPAGLAEQIANFSGLTVQVIDLGMQGKRDADSRSSKASGQADLHTN